MPKKDHIHVVTDEKHKELLVKLGVKFGSMTRAFEYAIENLEKSETVGSCEQCEIKANYEMAQKFRNLLNTVTFTADNIHELVKYLRGELTVRELLIRSREKAYEFGKQYNSFIRNPLENNFDNLLAIVKEYKEVNRFFKSIQVDHITKKIIARVNVLEDLPIFVLTGFMGYLESLDFTFDIELYQADVILRWLPPEQYQQMKERIEERILSYIREAEQVMKPYLMKKGHLLVSPQFLDWVSETVFDFQLLPINVAYHFASEAMIQVEDPTIARNIVMICENALYAINFADEISYEIDDNKNTFKFYALFKTASLAKITLQGFILILAKFGWKLKKHRMDGARLEVHFRYVGENDPSILEPLHLINFSGFLNQRFQKLRVIPIDEYNDLKSVLFELSHEKFDELFRKQGIKIAAAIKLLAKNDLVKMREIAFKVLPHALKQTQRDPKGIDFIPEPGKIRLVFKESNLVEMEQFRSIISGMAEEFGYANIKSRIFENMVIIEFIRPSEIAPDKTEHEKIEFEEKDVVPDSVE